MTTARRASQLGRTKSASEGASHIHLFLPVQRAMDVQCHGQSSVEPGTDSAADGMVLCRSQQKCTYVLHTQSTQFSRQHVVVKLDVHGTAWATNRGKPNVRINNRDFNPGHPFPLSNGDVLTVRYFKMNMHASTCAVVVRACFMLLGPCSRGAQLYTGNQPPCS